MFDDEESSEEFRAQPYGELHDIYSEKLEKGRCCYDCGGRMRPTRTTCGHEAFIRIFKCVDCGAERPWLDDPDMASVSANPHHRMKEGGFSVGSMLSDPNCDVFEKPEPTRTRTRTRTARRRTRRNP